MTTSKTIVLTIQTLVSKVISLLFNTLSRFVIAFLLRNKLLLISWLQSLSTVVLESKKRKSVTASTFPLLFAMKWWDWISWSSFFECWVLSQFFHSPLSLSSRNSFIPVCFLPLGWCHLLIWDCWYFSWQSWFQLMIYPTFHMRYSTQKLNKQGDNIQPWYTPFLILNQSFVPCLVLTVASWPEYTFTEGR